MVDSELLIQNFTFGKYETQVFVPEIISLRKKFEANKASGINTPFPFWAKLWPSAIAICDFIVGYPSIINQKNVLELAAGLGLPSIVAAQIAKTVTASDYINDAVEVMERSVALNHLTNTNCRQLDWHQLPNELKCEVLILSDINYDPVEFDVLYKVLTKFLQAGTTIILSTPQRLMAKSFIEKILPFCTQQQEMEVELNGEKSFITVMVLAF